MPQLPSTLYFASDHAGIALKSALVALAKEQGCKVEDLGPDTTDSVDYPDYAAKMADTMHSQPEAMGVLICGSGIGMSMAANRYSHLRAALCHHGLEARLTRQHNNANVLVLGARMIGADVAKECMLEFLKTEFEGGRHLRRVEKLASCTHGQ